MKPFRFALERVRQWRQEQVDMEELRLEQLYNGLRAAEQERAEIASEADRSYRAVVSKSAVMAEELSFLEAFRAYAAAQIDRLAARERELAAQITAQRQRLVEAHRRFQLVDGLRDRALVGWKAARDREQESLAAELFLAKYNRDMATGDRDAQ